MHSSSDGLATLSGHECPEDGGTFIRMQRSRFPWDQKYGTA
jgi:hypothetical protein